MPTLATNTGNQHWIRTFRNGDGTTSPSVRGKTVFFSADYLHAVNAQTGTDRWTARELRGTPLLLDDLDYLRAGGADGALYTLNLTTGEYHARFTPAPFNNSWDRWRVGMAVVNRSLYTGVGIDEPNTRHRSDHTLFYALCTPEFNYSNLSVTPQSPAINETVNVTVTVRNTGTGPGRFNATFAVDGNVANTTTARLDPRTNIIVTFTHSFERNGIYTLAVENRTQKVTVGDVAPATTPTATPTQQDNSENPTQTEPSNSASTESATTSTAATTTTISGTSSGYGVGGSIVAVALLVAVIATRRGTDSSGQLVSHGFQP